AKPSPVITPTATRLASSRFRALIVLLSWLRHDLGLVLLDRVDRALAALEAVVEELAPLVFRELAGEHRTLVALAVELDAPRDVPREALVDRDVTVGLHTDEVRARERPDDTRCEEDERRSGKGADRNARDASVLLLRSRRDRSSDPVELLPRDQDRVVHGR